MITSRLHLSIAVRTLVVVTIIVCALLGPSPASAQRADASSLIQLESGCGGSTASVATVSSNSGTRAPVPQAVEDPAAPPGAAIVLRAAVSAREVQFRSQPRVVVRLCGARGDSVRVLERRNLPTPVVAGTTYRDVYVAVEILGHLDGDCIAARLIGSDSVDTRRRCAALTISRSPDR